MACVKADVVKTPIRALPIAGRRALAAMAFASLAKIAARRCRTAPSIVVFVAMVFVRQTAARIRLRVTSIASKCVSAGTRSAIPIAKRLRTVQTIVRDPFAFRRDQRVSGN